MATSSLGTAWIQIKPSLSGISKDIENELGGASVSGGKTIQANLKSVFKGLGGNIEDTFTGAFSRVVTTTKDLFAAGIGGSIALLGSQLDNAFSRADTLNNFPKVMANFGVSAADATQMVKELDAGVRGLPTSLNSIVSLAQGFVPLTANTEMATKTALALNNAILAGGAPVELQTAAMEQFRQALSKGVPDLQDWKSVEMAMPAQLKQIAEALGIGSGALKGYSQNGLGVYQAMKDGMLTMDDFNNVLVNLNNNGINGLPSFAQQAKNATTGIVSNFTNMKTAITRSLANVVNGIPNFTQSIQGVGKAIEGTINGSMKPDEATKLVDNFFSGVSGAFTKVLVSLLPVILSSLTSLVSNIGSTITTLLGDSKNSQGIIKGFVQLFVAVAKAGGQIAMALLPVIPAIIGEFASELAKPENAGPIAAGLGILLGFSVLKTVSGNLKGMIGKSISNLFDGILGKNKAADAAADSIDKLSKASRNAPKSFTFGDSIASFFQNIGKVLSGAVEAVMAPIKTLLAGVGQAIAGFFQAFANPAILAGALIFAVAAASVAAAILLVGGAVGIVTPGIANFMNTVLLPLGAFLAGVLILTIATLTQSIIDLTNGAVIPLGSFLTGSLIATLDAIAAAIINVTNGAIIPLTNAISGSLMSILSSAGNLIAQVGGTITNVLGGALNGIKGVISSVGDAFTKMGGAIKTALDGVSGVLSAFKDIITAIGDAIIATVALATGRSIKYGAGFATVTGAATGGRVDGIGTATSDSNLYALSKGEYVIRAAAAQSIGYSNLDQLNANGGFGSGQSFSFGDIIINGYDKDPRELAQVISNEIALSTKRVMA